ncbi:MAG: hypothetical protein ACFFEA_08980 [Candidatus Thorarchaeota archaeon]
MNYALINAPENFFWANPKMILKNEWLIPLGGLCLAIALTIDHFLPENEALSFLMGILIGLSITLNLVGLYRSRNE